jgi:hypothetical protein
MSPAMSRAPFRLAIGLVVLGSIVLAGPPAHACSCVRMDVGARLEEVDGAFVGTFVDRQEIGQQQVFVTFDVERVLKGDFGPRAIVRTNASGGSCGLESLDGPRTGLLLDRADDGVWQSYLCDQLPPVQLLGFAGEGRPPDPDIAAIDPVGARMSPVWTILGVVALAALGGLALLVRARRQASSRDLGGVA